MNRRQKKKHFKKIYGMNPKQYEKWKAEKMPKILMENGIVNGEKVALAIHEGVRKMGEMAIEAAKILREGMDAWAEEIKVAAGFMETENMLSQAEPLPEYAEKQFLKHIGIRMDRYGAAYDFYFDEANKAYFVEVLQEGGESGC